MYTFSWTWLAAPVGVCLGFDRHRPAIAEQHAADESLGHPDGATKLTCIASSKAAGG